MCIPSGNIAGLGAKPNAEAKQLQRPNELGGKANADQGVGDGAEQKQIGIMFAAIVEGFAHVSIRSSAIPQPVRTRPICAIQNVPIDFPRPYCLIHFNVVDRPPP